jgi:serine carboxypeptidase 1
LCEFGPVDLCGESTVEKPRTYTWLNESHALVFLDQPVGTGFSYVRKSAGYAKSEEDLVRHMTIVVKQMYSRFTTFHGRPLYIFSESYGGKMNAYISVGLFEQRSQIPGLNLAGVALGDSWISPEEAVKSYGEYFYQLSHADDVQKAKIDSYATKMSDLIRNNDWTTATDVWGDQQGVISEVTGGISFYNFLRHSEYTYNNMTQYINTIMRSKLNKVLPAGKSIPDDVKWQLEAGDVFENLASDFMKPSVKQVITLLQYGVKVIVYNGQLDVIVPTPSTLAWINQMTEWKGLSNWQTAPSVTVTPNPPSPQDVSGLIGRTNIAFRKKYQNLDLWRVLFAGHMVPQDNPLVGYEMFKRVTNEAYDKQRTAQDLSMMKQRPNKKLQKL